MILKLPLEILEIIYLHLDSKSCICLLKTCTSLHFNLGENVKFYRHVCRGLGLDTVEWCGQASDRNADFWKCLHDKSVAVENVLSTRGVFEVDRIHVDINSFKLKGNAKVLQKVLKLPEAHKNVPDYKPLRRKLISESIFSYAMSDLYFVLVVSNSKSYKSHLTVWNTSKTISYAFSVNHHSSPNSELANLWLACSEDILVHKHYLILMATKAEPSNFFNEAKPCNSDLLYIYDLKKRTDEVDHGFLVAKYTLKSAVRFLPLILKEGGGSKLMVWGNLLLAVCPETSEEYYKYEPDTEPSLVIRCFDLTSIMAGDMDSGVQQLELVAEHRLQGVRMKQPYSYIASDQKGPNIVMSFSRQDHHCMSQQFVILSLKRRETFLSSITTYNTTNMTRIPSLLSLSNGVRRREQSLIAASENPSVFAVMDASGLVQLADGQGKFKQFYPVYGISDDFDTFYDELHIYGERVVTMKIFHNREMSVGSKNTILAVSNLEGDLLWKIRTNIVLTNTGERLYLSPMFNHLFVSDAKKAVVYDLTSGQVKNIVHYPRHKRQSKELDSQDPDISAYAQTGVSIWELTRVGDRVLVVHDVERFNPVIVDFIDFLG